ncbi:MAG: ATP-binding protein [Anaerolineae bacterium]
MHVTAAPDVPAIQGDRVRLGQILNNLVGNAVKFTPSGHVWLRAFGSGDEVCIEVEDTGPGISERDVAAIFRPFRHADSPFTRRARGAGLGLAITLFLVELHDGAIEVRSRPGVGTVFTVRLPAARASAAPPLQGMAKAATNGALNGSAPSGNGGAGVGFGPADSDADRLRAFAADPGGLGAA